MITTSLVDRARLCVAGRYNAVRQFRPPSHKRLRTARAQLAKPHPQSSLAFREINILEDYIVCDVCEDKNANGRHCAFPSCWIRMPLLREPFPSFPMQMNWPVLI
jgi:hypothetical protein